VLLPYVMLGKCDMQVLRTEQFGVLFVIFDLVFFNTSYILLNLNFIKEFLCKMYV
jgi:hypothetical protein